MSARRALDGRAWDQIAGGAGVVVGVLVSIFGSRLEFGAWNNPGPGMMPVLVGLFIVFLSAALLVASLRMPVRGKENSTVASPWATTDWRPVLATLAALLAYASLLDALGYVAATYLLLLVLLRVLEPPAWSITLITAGVITGCSYGLFAKLLQVQLPRAPWGF